MTTGTTHDLVVSVTDVGWFEPFPTAFQEAEQLRGLSGLVFNNQDVPTGGYVRVKITDCVHLLCHPLSAGRQPVVQINHPVYWTWAITATKAGTGLIVLAEVLYRGGSQNILHQALPIQLRVNVSANSIPSPSPSQRPPPKSPGWFSSVEHVILTAAGIIAALTIIIGGVVAVVRSIRSMMERARRKTKASHPDQKTEPEQKSTATHTEE